ncbi:hypothetical protein ONZ45_g8256 [Pleurotus djamor]|nr:hypothetical protein ONZ45_g8256 [Pleurotus djamor]
MFKALASAIARRTARSKPAVIEVAVEPSQLPSLYPWKDIHQRLAIHCGQSVRKLMPPSQSPAFATPSVSLEVFIERILRESKAPLSATLGALAVINWLTEGNMSPLACSSPHHLFLSAYQLFVQGMWGMYWDNEDWVNMFGGCISEKEISAMKIDVAEAMSVSTKATPEWEMLSWLSQDSTSKLIEDMFDEERIQSGSTLFESRDMRSMEYNLRMTGIWVVYEWEDDEDVDDDEFT